MKGDNFYNENSSYQKAVNVGVTPQVIAAASAVASTLHPSHVVIADLGCSQGANSQQPVSTLIQELRKDGTSASVVSVYHADQPHNDFNSLFKVLAGDTSYLRHHEKVYAYAQGRSFYESLFAPASVHIAFCFNSVHWMSKKPQLSVLTLSPRNDIIPEADAKGMGITSISLFFFLFFLSGFLASAETIHHLSPFVCLFVFVCLYVCVCHSAISDASREDLRNFMRHRAEELVPGGQLVLTVLLWKEVTNDHLMTKVSSILTELVAEGLLPVEDARNMMMPGYPRSEEETVAVFDEFRDVFQLEESRLERTGHPLYAKFKAGEIPKEVFISAVLNFLRALMEPGLMFSQNPARPGLNGYLCLFAPITKLNKKLLWAC